MCVQMYIVTLAMLSIMEVVFIVCVEENYYGHNRQTLILAGWDAFYAFAIFHTTGKKSQILVLNCKVATDILR